MPETIAPGGFEILRFEENRAEFVILWAAEWGQGANTASDTPDGHIIDWGTAMSQYVLEKSAEAYSAGFPTTAGSVTQLAQLLAPMFGSFPNQETPTRGSALCFGVVGTTIFQGSAVTTSQTGDVFAAETDTEIVQDIYLAFVFASAVDTTTSVKIGPVDYAVPGTFTGTGLEVAQRQHDFMPVADAQIDTLFQPYEDQAGNGVIIVKATSVFISEILSTGGDADFWRASQVTFVAESSGPIVAEAFTVTRITSALTGWEGVVNIASLTTGTAIDSVASYLQRHLDTIGKNGTSTLVGLISRLRDTSINPGIEHVEIYNNPLDEVDSGGRPRKSFEVVKLGGDDLIAAETIWEHHPLGIESFGEETFVVRDERTDRQNLVSLTNATELFIWADFQITPGEGFPDLPISDIEAQVRDRETAFGNSRGVGLDAYISDLATAMDLTGVSSVVITLGTTSSPISAPPPLAGGNLSVDDRTILRWDQTRITVKVLDV